MSDRDEPRRSWAPYVRSTRSEVLDEAADMGMDAVEFGDVDAAVVADALEQAAREVRDRGGQEVSDR